MRVLRFNEFLNESQSINEKHTWEGKNIFKFGSTPLTQELKDASIKKWGNRTKSASVYYDNDPSKKDIVSQLESECKSFLTQYKPFNFNLKWGGFKKNTVGTVKEIIPFDPRKAPYIYASFLGVLNGPLGKVEIEFDVRAMDGLLLEFDWTIDHFSNSFRAYVKSSKVQAFLKDAYLSIPDTREKDELLMNKSARVERGSNWLEYWNLPKTFTAKVDNDPIFKASTILDEYHGYDDIVEIFQELNKKHYAEWHKLNRKGLRGAIKDIKAWWLSEQEHFDCINEYNEDEIPGGLADDLSIKDIAKRHQVSVGQIEAQLEKGKKVEMEHTDDPKKAEEIAKDHLMEMPDYYDKLEKIEPAHESVNEAKKVLADREGNKDTGNKIIDKYLKGMRQGTIQVAWNMISVRGGVVDFNSSVDFTVAYDNFKDEYMVFGDGFETLSQPSSAIKNDEDLHKLIGSAVNGHTFSR